MDRPLEIVAFGIHPLSRDGWVQLPFLTREIGTEEPYFIGTVVVRPISIEPRPDCVQLKEKVIMLSTPIPYQENRCLWATPEGVVWHADSKDPIADNERVQMIETHPTNWFR